MEKLGIAGITAEDTVDIFTGGLKDRTEVRRNRFDRKEAVAIFGRGIVGYHKHRAQFDGPKGGGAGQHGPAERVLAPRRIEQDAGMGGRQLDIA